MSNLGKQKVHCKTKKKIGQEIFFYLKFKIFLFFLTQND